MIRNSRQLAQSSPANNSAYTLYAPSTGVKAEVYLALICNYTASSSGFSLFADADGSTNSNATAIHASNSILANTSVHVYFEKTGLIVDGTNSGTIGFKADDADALTVTLYGAEIVEG